MQKSIRPDIIAQIGTGPDARRSSWTRNGRSPVDGKPGDADLQQMHAYNVQFGAQRSFLIYPKVGTEADVEGRFLQGEALPPSFDHNCGMVFLELFDGEYLRHDLGKHVMEMLTCLS